ncbi:MAG TPA: hypothetical protein VMZ33_02220, partial [Candidatus Limnocylindrales bacterium]|nr:hypothetical protein [Candidatus Limnocylindrales bacterium]
DLAGHEQDSNRYRRVLENVDRWIPRILERLGSEGVLFVAADHGNDPMLGTSRHTREYVPILVAGQAIGPLELGTRTSLSDIAATIAELLGAAPVPAGRSFARLLGPVSAHALETRETAPSMMS